MQQGMWGADADALEALGRDMQASAARIDTIARQISAQLMGSPWDGGDADRFRADWNRRYRGQMRSAAEFLRQAQRTLTASGQDQRQASADHGELAGSLAGAIAGMSGAVGSVAAGWTAPGPGTVPDWQKRVRDAAATLWGTSRGTAEGWEQVTAPLAGLATLAGAATVGRYTNAYRPLLAFGDLMRFKQSPVLQAMDRLEGPIDRVLNNPVFKGVDAVARGVSVVAETIDGADVLSDFLAGRADGGDLARAGAELAASGLKSSKNPVSYLAGVNVSIWSDVVESGVKAFESGDFTLRGLPSPLSKEAFSEVYVQSAKDVGSQLWSMAKGWF